MIQIEANLLNNYNLSLQIKQIPKNQHKYYLKWLRYYLDFCHKYNFQNSDPESLHRFIGKLRSKKQTIPQQEQATNAIRLFYTLSKSDNLKNIYNVTDTANKIPIVTEVKAPYLVQEKHNIINDRRSLSSKMPDNTKIQIQDNHGRVPIWGWKMKSKFVIILLKHLNPIKAGLENFKLIHSQRLLVHLTRMM